MTWVAFVPKELPRTPTTSKYSIDGGSPVSFRLNGLSDGDSAGSLSNQIFFTTPDLKPGRHSISVSFQGNSTTTPLILDYLLVGNSTSTADPSPSTPSSSPQPGDQTTKKAVPIAAIIGGVIGGILVFATIIGLIFCLRRRKRAVRPLSLDLANDEFPATFPQVEVTPFHSPTAPGMGGYTRTNNSYPSFSQYNHPTLASNSESAHSASGAQGSDGIPDSVYGGIVRNQAPSGSYQPSRKRQEAAMANPSTHSVFLEGSNTSRVVLHEDSGLRIPHEPAVIDVPPTYTAS